MYDFNFELNPMIIEVIKMTSQGMTDIQIGAALGKRCYTITWLRHKYKIASGRSNKHKLVKPKVKKSKLVSLDKLY